MKGSLSRESEKAMGDVEMISGITTARGKCEDGKEIRIA